MSIRTTAELMAEPIGKEIGASDDVTQAALLNGFCEALSRTCGRDHLDMQVCWIEDKLSPEARRVLQRIVGFVDYRAETSQ